LKAYISAIVLASFTAQPVFGQTYSPVTDKGAFLQLLSDKNLTDRLYGINIAIAPNGTLSGSGAGWEITGTWSWIDGYFCREMNWGGDPIPYNCQLVELAGGDMRFTTDKGTGDSAAFTLR
jgi:hypothetical protein